MFPATDEEQWEFIKKVIDDCDYYLLIIGGRYGSLSNDGISYTEKEYRYAVEKGIKVIAFLHQSPDELAVVKTDIDPNLMAKLKEFRENVATGRLVKFWNHANELPGLVALSLTKTIKMYPAVGWVRANNQSSAESLGEINELRKENDKLRNALENSEAKPKFSLPNLADYSESIELGGTYVKQFSGTVYDWKTEMTWSEIFGAISPYLLEHPSDNAVKIKLKQNAFSKLNLHSYSTELKDQTFQTVKMQLMALGLVDVSYTKTTKGGMGLFWRMTESGKGLMLKLRTIPSNDI
ncbi:conserved hypothetical protein [Vibrio coralliirubri]|nr:conserved hypothetical protein [Vibrio coralliirubri]